MNQKWRQILGLALSLPGTIFVSGYFCMHLVKNNYLPLWAGASLFLLIVFNLLISMVVYANRKNKK